MNLEYALLLLLIIPALYCLYKCKEKSMQAYFVHLHLMPLKLQWLRLEQYIKYLIIILLISALSSPVIQNKYDPQNRNGIDIVLSLDASGSMGSSGFDKEQRQLDRFEVLQGIVQEFISRRTQDNVGIVVYGDFAFIASPITYEKEIVNEMISYLSSGIAGQNTAIGEGLAMGVRAFKHSKAETKVIILLSDGEHNSGSISPQDAITMSNAQNIRVYTIGIGNKGEFNKTLLEKIANESGGEFFAAYDSEELSEVYKEIEKLEKSKIKSKAYISQEYFYQYPLSLALLLGLFLLYRKEKR